MGKEYWSIFDMNEGEKKKKKGKEKDKKKDKKKPAHSKESKVFPNKNKEHLKKYDSKKEQGKSVGNYGEFLKSDAKGIYSLEFRKDGKDHDVLVYKTPKQFPTVFRPGEDSITFRDYLNDLSKSADKEEIAKIMYGSKIKKASYSDLEDSLINYILHDEYVNERVEAEMMNDSPQEDDDEEEDNEED
jgi:hypothetical protein